MRGVGACAWVLIALCVGCSGPETPSPQADVGVDTGVDASGSDASGEGQDAAPEDVGGQEDGGRDVGPPPDVLTRYDSVQRPVRVVIDDVGAPHIYGENALDVYFAAGWQQASERLFEIDVNRRRSIGTLAEAWGEDGVDADVQARALGFGLRARQTMELMAREHPEEHDLIVAFTGGVNAYVDAVLAGNRDAPEAFERLGYAPTRFEPWELMAIGVRINFGFASTLEFDLLNTLEQRLPDTGDVPIYDSGADAFIMVDQQIRSGGFAPPTRIPHITPMERAPTAAELEQMRVFARKLERFGDLLGVGEGSNAWTVRGDHTFNGRPILANDSHARMQSPNVMYLTHLNTAAAGGDLDVMGMGFLGVPGVQVG